MTRSPGFFARDSQAGFYGPDMAPAGRRSPATDERSFGQLLKRIAVAGFAVAVAVSVMAPTARAATPDPAEAMAGTRNNLAMAVQYNGDYAKGHAARLAAQGKEVCWIVQQVSFTSPHEKRYVGDMPQLSIVESVDCDVIRGLNATAKAKLDAAATRAVATGQDLDLDFLKTTYPQLKVEKSTEAAFAKAANRNAVLLDQAADPMSPRLR